MRCDAPNLSEMKGGKSETKCQAGRKLEGVHVLRENISWEEGYVLGVEN